MSEMSELKREIPKNRIEIAKMKNRRGQIGNQGFTAEGVERTLRSINGNFISEGSSLKEMLDVVRDSPEMLQATKNYLEENPIEISLLPDDSIHLSDGHHRSFIADQIGMTSLPYQESGQKKEEKVTDASGKKELPRSGEVLVDKEYILKSEAETKKRIKEIGIQLGI
jgi:hypothetical protein